jgi:hypothetical protein
VPPKNSAQNVLVLPAAQVKLMPLFLPVCCCFRRRRPSCNRAPSVTHPRDHVLRDSGLHCRLRTPCLYRRVQRVRLRRCCGVGCDAVAAANDAAVAVLDVVAAANDAAVAVLDAFDVVAAAEATSMVAVAMCASLIAAECILQADKR